MVERARARDLVELLFVDFDGLSNYRWLRLAGTAFANIRKVLGGNCDWIYRKQDNFESAAWVYSRPFFPFIWHTFRTPSARKPWKILTDY